MPVIANDSKSIAEKMHIFSQMQGSPTLTNALLIGLELLRPGFAFSYVNKRCQEVMKLSEL